MSRLGGVRLRPTRGAAVVALLSLALLASSRTTGSGWLTVMVSLGIATLIWGSIGPVLLVRRVSVSLAGPSDAMVGRRLELQLDVHGPRAGCRIRVLEPESEVFGVLAPASGGFSLVPRRRGVLSSLPVEVETASGLGLVEARRVLDVPLPRPIDVAPRPVRVELPKAATSAGEGETSVGGRHTEGETVRTVREYRDGDPLRMIHWASSARRDALVVKELESPQSPALIVSLDLRGNPEVAERHASLAAGYVQAGLRSGMPIRLHTMEEAGQHSGWVGSSLEAGRRLARAVPGQVVVAPSAERAAMVHLGPR